MRIVVEVGRNRVRVLVANACTTTPRAGGSGLGLETTRVKANKLGGYLDFSLRLAAEKLAKKFCAHSDRAAGGDAMTDRDFEARPLSLVIVDDDPVVRDLLPGYFADSRWRVVDVVATVAEAREVVVHGGVDVVLTDSSY